MRERIILNPSSNTSGNTGRTTEGLICCHYCQQMQSKICSWNFISQLLSQSNFINETVLHYNITSRCAFIYFTSYHICRNNPPLLNPLCSQCCYDVSSKKCLLNLRSSSEGIAELQYKGQTGNYTTAQQGPFCYSLCMFFRHLGML